MSNSDDRIKLLTRKRGSIKAKTDLETLSEVPDEAFGEREQFEQLYYQLVAEARSLLKRSSLPALPPPAEEGSEAGSSAPHVKAVHLELVTDLSKEAFLAALARFTARREIQMEKLQRPAARRRPGSTEGRLTTSTPMAHGTRHCHRTIQRRPCKNCPSQHAKRTITPSISKLVLTT
ncbi:uncharacterized protein LOC105396586 isoform X7 [Plutella xylostella]|uniref:uncharacterized protein LOC105396586 isoform X7 n=1 Tax=Plutella xylostella TaxID=51655 RepID=UPI0018D0330F|nr:uncharacterized protein LOC105396586 isoform X7 [Plutella xylostella]